MHMRAVQERTGGGLGGAGTTAEARRGGAGGKHVETLNLHAAKVAWVACAAALTRTTWSGWILRPAPLPTHSLSH